MTLILRATKGTTLTPAEMDGNFYHLRNAVRGLETYRANNGPLQLDDVTEQGGALTFAFSDASTIGPVDVSNLPWRWRGSWLPSVTYLVGDVFFVNNDGVYLVEEEHISEATFDPDADVGADVGIATYSLVFAWPDPPSGVEVGGSGDHSPFHGGVYTINTWSVTPTLEQAGGYFRVGNDTDGFGGGTAGFFIPKETSSINPVNFAIGTRFWVRDRTGTSATFDHCYVTTETFGTGDRAALIGPAGDIRDFTDESYYLNGYGAVAEIVKVASNKWEIWGDITAGDSGPV